MLVSHSPRISMSFPWLDLHFAPRNSDLIALDCATHLHTYTNWVNSESYSSKLVFTHPQYICSSTWTVKVIVDISMSSQCSFENFYSVFILCFSAQLEVMMLELIFRRFDWTQNQNQMNPLTIVEPLLDFPVPVKSPALSPFEPCLQGSSSPKPIWL